MPYPVPEQRMMMTALSRTRSGRTFMTPSKVSAYPAPTILLGAHFSIANGLENAIYRADKLDCRTLQLFTKNARTWKEKTPDAEEIRLFSQARQSAGVDVILSHASYLINIASPEAEKREKSIQALQSELDRSALLGIDHVVLHPGAFMASDEQSGIRKAGKALKRVLSHAPSPGPRLLIETTAGQGTQLGHTFEQLAQILAVAGHPDQTGICLDTSHIFAAGYDFTCRSSYTKTFSLFDEIIGVRHLFAMHLNDSKTGLGSRKDRHDHIGKGMIGRKPFGFIMNDPRLAHIPKILETPKYMGDTDMDPVNLKVLRDLVD